MTNEIKATLRYAEILEKGAWVTHQEQDEIAKLLRKLVMTEAWDTSDMAYRPNGLTFSKPWIGLNNKDFQYQTSHDVITMRYAEALLKAKNT